MVFLGDEEVKGGVIGGEVTRPSYPTKDAFAPK